MGEIRYPPPVNASVRATRHLLCAMALALLAWSPALSSPEEKEKPKEDQESRHGHHHPSDETDDATARHPFDEIDKWVARFDDPTRDEWQKPDEVVAALKLSPGMTVADLGAGTGYFNRRLSEAVGPEGKVLAVDIEPAMVKHMQERAEQEKTPNVTPILARPADPKLPMGGVDLVLIVDTYHHFDDRLQYFQRLKRAMKPGGRLAIIDFHKRELPVGPDPDHKLEREQVVAEMEAAGWRLEREPDFLPYQYFLIFEPR